MNVYSCALNIDFEVLNSSTTVESIVTNSYGKKNYHCPINANQHLNPKLLRLLESVKLFPAHCEIFYSPPHLFSGIHVDIGHGDRMKINWIFGGERSTMNWYRLKDTVSPRIPDKSKINTLYVPYDLTEVDLVYTEQLANPSIVQVGVPHNITNYSQDRYCVSVVPGMWCNGEIYRPTVDEALNIFSKFLI
jgi:hypothetical protein